ncbi:MAG: SusF/SusE family outer membrane protein [Flavobacteriaceae bacterium]
MKKLLYIFLLTLTSVSLSSCFSDDFDAPIMNPDTSFELFTSKEEVVLDMDFPDQVAFTLSWLEPDYGFESATPDFEIRIEGITFTSIRGWSISPLAEDVNLALISNKLLSPGVPTELQVDVVAVNGSTEVSESVNITFTAYAVDPVLLSNWGVVGTQNDWGGTPDFPMFMNEVNNILTSYVTLDKGADVNEYKFRMDNAWDTQWGINDGVPGQDNPGTYRPENGTYIITLNPENGESTQTSTSISAWGLVGSAVNDWGATPDALMYVSEDPDVLISYTYMTEGEFKFRKDNAWDENYGSGDEEGTLSPGGGNIAIPYASWYRVTWNTVDNTYTLQAFQ